MPVSSSRPFAEGIPIHNLDVSENLSHRSAAKKNQPNSVNTFPDQWPLAPLNNKIFDSLNILYVSMFETLAIVKHKVRVVIRKDLMVDIRISRFVMSNNLSELNDHGYQQRKQSSYRIVHTEGVIDQT
jgi:hypothetical protein